MEDLVKVKIVIYSHLNDLMMNKEDLNFKTRMNFVKYLINKFPNTEVEIDPNKEWDNFLLSTETPKYVSISLIINSESCLQML